MTLWEDDWEVMDIGLGGARVPVIVDERFRDGVGRGEDGSGWVSKGQTCW
jgi:hypothetical protein